MGICEDLRAIASLLTPEAIWLNIVVLTAAAFLGLVRAAAIGSVLFTFKPPSPPKRWADARLKSIEARLPAWDGRNGEEYRTGLGLARAAPAVLNALVSRPAPSPGIRDAMRVAGPAPLSAAEHCGSAASGGPARPQSGSPTPLKETAMLGRERLNMAGPSDPERVFQQTRGGLNG